MPTGVTRFPLDVRDYVPASKKFRCSRELSGAIGISPVRTTAKASESRIILETTGT
jgi:hypothetical protein